MKEKNDIIILLREHLPPNTQTPQEVSNKLLLFVEENEGYFYTNTSDPTKDKELNQELIGILKKTITVENGSMKFDVNAAYKGLLAYESKQLYFARDIEHTGIQEKYLKSQLSAHEPLTELDVKRFILQTDMAGIIHVANVNNIESILQKARAVQQDTHEPYSIALMINAQSEQSPQWVSAVINFNPLDSKYSVHINVEDERQKQLMESKISQAMQTAFNNPVLTKVTKTTSKIEGKAGEGYKVLHELYRDASISSTVSCKPKAKQFSKMTTNNVKSIKKSVYETQLKAIQVKPEQSTILNPTLIQNNFVNGQITEEALNKLIISLDTSSVPVTAQHPLVLEQSQEVRPFQTKIIFPDQKPEPPLKSVDYHQFLLLLRGKLQSSGIKIVPNEMVINCYDSEGLKGLIAYNDSNLPLPFHKLTLNLDNLQPEAYEAFLFNLKTLMLTMSDQALSELKLVRRMNISTNKQFDAMMEDLTEFIQKRPVAINITLSEGYYHTTQQRLIDEMISDRIRERTRVQLNKQAASQTTGYQDSGPVRTRPRPGSGKKQEVSREIELEQDTEQQAEVAVQVEITKINESNVVVDGRTELFGFNRFNEAINTREFDSNIKCHLVDKSRLKELWCNWVGALTIFEADSPFGIRMTKSACEELLRHVDKFQFGLDLNNLPPGFRLKTDSQLNYIDFNKDLKCIDEYNPLKVQTYTLAREVPLTHLQFTKWLNYIDHRHPIVRAWNKLCQEDSYSSEDHRVFRQFLPQMLLLNEDQLALLFKLSKSNNKLDVKEFQRLLEDGAQLNALFKLAPDEIDYSLGGLFSFNEVQDVRAFIERYNERTPDFDNHLLAILIDNNQEVRLKIRELLQKVPTLNLNALLQVYAQTGKQGIDELSQLVDKNPEIFKHLDKHVFSHYKSYMPLLQSEVSNAIEAIAGFSANRNEYLWWNTLLEQHCKAAKSEVNIVDMVNAFKQFKEGLKIENLPTNDGKPLEFSDVCELKQIKSLPVTLSRILTLLNNASPENRAAQWNQIAHLDWSSTGAIKPIAVQADKKWAFISPQMNINAQNERGADLDKDVFQYKTVSRWKWINGITTKQTVENFFRYVAFQAKEEQLPLEFYLHVQKIIDENNFSLEVQQLLYPLIASATTGASSVALVKTLDDSLKDVDNLIKLVKQTPLPLLMPESLKEEIRLSMLDSLTKLNQAPPLPVFSLLFTLITSSVDNIAKLAWNSQKLTAAIEQLVEYVAKYGTAVYEGMNHYSDTDYKKASLFFSHLEIIDIISKTFNAPYYGNPGDLLRLISLFHLDADSVKKIIEQHFKDNDENFIKRRTEALNLLYKLSTENKKPLTSDDFLHILNNIKSRPVEPVFKIINELKLQDGTLLADYLPKKILENYDKKGMPANDTNKINHYFTDRVQQEQISKALLRFNKDGDADQYNELIDKIIKICDPLSPIEQKFFIEKLTSTLSLYNDPEPLNAGNSFVALLDVLIKHNSIDGFMSFITAERRLLSNMSMEQRIESLLFVPTDNPEHVEELENLSAKAVLYLSILLPEIKSINNLKLSQVELTPRILETILKTPDFALTEKSQFKRFESDYFEAQEQVLEEALAAIEHEEKIQCGKLIEITGDVINNALPEDNSLFVGFKELTTKISENKKINNEQLQILKEKLPSISKNKNGLNVLFNNPQFISALAEQDVIEAFSDEYLIDNEKSNKIFTALEKDLKGIDAFQKQIKNLQKELRAKSEQLNTYPNDVVGIFRIINNIVAANPTSKKQLLELYDRYLQDYAPGTSKDGELTHYLYTFVQTLEKTFANITDKNLVLSLCLQFNSDTDEELQPKKLMKLLQIVEGFPKENQETMLKIAVALINNEKGYTLAEFERLCKVSDPETKNIFTQFPAKKFLPQLTKIYAKAPIPTIEEVLQWHKKAPKNEHYEESMKQSHLAYCKKPCAREKNNGFDAKQAKNQFANFAINGKKPTEAEIESSEEYFQYFEKLTKAMQGKSPATLLDILKSFAEQKEPDIDYDLLVAVAAELLYRSKGKEGSSMEINTTQYLAILTMLKTPSHSTSQIGTGEGKSRIMMISLACQAALGKTVDFVTSDAQLATRDYVQYQAYFEMMDVKTSMIFAHTDPSEYKMHGINFSDPANLSLFRNKARSMGRGKEVIDTAPKNRAVNLDEADKTYFDMASTRFNYSTEADESIKDMEWVYPLLMNYFAEKELILSSPVDGKHSMAPLELFYNNVDRSREEFLKYAAAKYSSAQLMRLQTLSNAQLEQWQVSAVTASQLKFMEDFVIEPDGLIRVAASTKISSEAQLLSANRVSKSSKLSFGVHQCVHALLNIIRENPEKCDDPHLREAVQKCESPFHIPDEKQIVYSSTSKNLLDDYGEGTLKAVTGTAGSIIEREEAARLYGEKDKNDMQFIDVPRDKGLKRKDKALLLTANQKEQTKAIIQEIKKARANNQPILIIAENDRESELLFTVLSKVFPENIQRVHSQSGDEEKKCIEQAGLPGQITVSTDMIGRGTDISLKELAQEKGLKVRCTYLPSLRDLQQIFGRAGRFGAEGDAGLILDKKRLEKQFNRKLGSDFFRNVEAYIEHEQAVMDRNKQVERLIKNTVGDFRLQLHNVFFENILAGIDTNDHKKVIPSWTGFFDKSDKAWNELWPHIQKELEADKIDVTKINTLLKDYGENVQKMWGTLQQKIQNLEIKCNYDSTKVNEALFQQPLLLNNITKNIITDFDISQYSLKNVKVYKEYEPGHAGRAVTYEHWYTPIIPFLKGYANLLPGVNFADARPPFANFRAWIGGYGQLFADTRAALYHFMERFRSHDKEIVSDDATKKSNGSYDLLLQKGVLGQNYVPEKYEAETNSNEEEEDEAKEKINEGPEFPELNRDVFDDKEEDENYLGKTHNQ